jgi:dynein assembly factor 5
LLAQSDDASLSLQYLLPILIERLGAVDLEGVASLPEVMRPPPSQKPMVVKSPPEPCEEIRLKMAELLHIIVATNEESSLRAYVDELVNLLRTLSMDPHGPVVQEACIAIGELCNNAKELVFHYTESLGRSLLTALVHKHSKVRIAGLDALRRLFYVGVFKYNNNVMEALIGFRDPNVVPIKDFYQASTKVLMPSLSLVQLFSLSRPRR